MGLVRTRQGWMDSEGRVCMAATLPAPQWIDTGAQVAGGLDLLGLRLPVQALGGLLLDGITTVTPQVRYIGLRAWLIHKYGETGAPDTWEHFTRFALRLESAIVLGNLAADREIGGLIGADEAVIRLEADSPVCSIAPLVKSPASTIYTGPSDQLGVTCMRGDAVPAVVRTRGLPLAASLEHRLRKLGPLRRIAADASIESISRDDLAEIGDAVRIDRIPGPERDLLLASILPGAPRPSELARMATYTALLTLASALDRRPTEFDLFRAAASTDGFGEPALDDAADGWVMYCVRDAIAVTQESVLVAVVSEISAQSSEGRFGVSGAGVIEALMERVEEHAAPLRELDLLGQDEGFAELRFDDLRQRLRQRTSGTEQRRGITRWTTGLLESDLYQLSMRSGAGALTLALVALLLADMRIGSGVREGIQSFSGLSYQGWRRMGLSDVVLPALQKFDAENRPVRDVAAELAHRAVAQHLQIVWSRLQVDASRDVALMATDGDMWFGRGKRFYGGRTASRLGQALGWLQQLRLIDAGGLTADGEVARLGALAVLAREVAA